MRGKKAIEVENLSKQYRLGFVGTGTLKDDLNRWWHLVRGKEDPYLKIGETNVRSQGGESDYVWALKDINFSVNEGEVLGIIGKNGAGKSTLLKILSRVTGPTVGEIRYNGRLASLLEVGTGFHPELTGRENIYLNGTLLGMSKKEVDAKLDEIIEFAGVARYVDTPVKRYSSGMTVRLGFAVAAHLEPDILVVDEVLAVGDAEFQRKAVGKMKDVSSSTGRTVLFVSHNMASVQALCTRCVVLDNGTVSYDGATTDAINFYLKKGMLGNDTLKKWSLDEAPGNEKVKITSVAVRPLTGKLLNIDSGFEISYSLMNFQEGKNIGTTIELITQEEVVVFHKGVLITENRDSVKGTYNISVKIPPFLLNSNHYRLKVIVGENQRYLIYNHNSLVSFQIENTNTGQGSNMNKVPGVIRPNLEWKVDFEGKSVV